jgi:tetratricopeptide (TPR) repeat protein
VDTWVAEAKAAVKERPQDPVAYRMLATVYMRKQRASHQAEYYALAETAARKSLQLGPGSYESRAILAWVLAGDHRFEEARSIAKACIHERPADDRIYGVLADCETELGDYDAAVAAVQKMIDRKPGLSSYARAGLQRRLHGDLHGDPKGALEALEMAIESGSPRDPESLAWCRVMKGDVLLQMGQAGKADVEFSSALERQPGYPLAIVGRARCQAALAKWPEAARFYRQALRATEEPPWRIALGDVLWAAGNRAAARQEYSRAYRTMRSEPSIPEHDREMALFLSDQGGDKAGALSRARRAAASRGDITTWDTLAWALYRNGQYRAAWQASLKARRLGTRDARFLYHAGMIAARLPGRTREARELLRSCLAIHPRFDPRQAPIAQAQLASLTSRLSRR